MVVRQVRTALGVVEGLAEEEPWITSFKGVPFAKPPVGGLRWRAPQPAEAWDGVLAAHAFAPKAMQPNDPPDTFYGHEWGIEPDTPVSEDCLYLNIWTPALRGVGSSTHLAAAKEMADLPSDRRLMAAPDGPGLPVMVWIYGGGYQNGGTCEKEFDGTELARHGVLVVSVAYRVNVFGFFAHPDLDPARDGANLGFLDQRMALAWVREHIADFGGDPDNVTIFGQSAGASSVLTQVCSPASRGLFRRAIMQSGEGVLGFNRHVEGLEYRRAIGERFLRSLGADSVEAARRIPADELLEAAWNFPAPEGIDPTGKWLPWLSWSPCVDGVTLTGQYADLLRAGAGRGIDLLFGNTTGEFVVRNEAGIEYPEGEAGNLAMARAWMEGAPEARPYCYRFDVAMPGDDAGAFHSSDLWFTFGTLDKCWRPFAGWHHDLARAMNGWWANFAACGDPNGTGECAGSDGQGRTLPHWDAYDPADGHAAMRLCEHPALERDWPTALELAESRR